MTPAERQQLKRDRRKAGLVRIEAWVPAPHVKEVMALLGLIEQANADARRVTGIDAVLGANPQP